VSVISSEKRREFYDVMLDDSDRLLHTIEQVLRTGQAGRAPLHRVRFDLRRARRGTCVALTRTRGTCPTDGRAPGPRTPPLWRCSATLRNCGKRRS
jgi:hypothetical protein